MNNKLEEQLAQIIEKAISIAEKTGEFVIDQGTDLLKEFFLWHTTEYLFFLVIGVALLITSFKIINLFGNKEGGEIEFIEDAGYSFARKRNVDLVLRLGRYFNPCNEIEIAFAYVTRYLLMFISIWIIIKQTYNLLFITIAPKLYLIEYFVK